MQVSVLASPDWLIIAVVLLTSVAVGFLVKDKVGQQGLAGYFVAGRETRWWLLGTSMVATSFASDTPLAITGWIAKYGIAGNWFWWGQVAATMALTVFFARRWRYAGIITDAEVAELRYGGKPAALLRTIKAALSATILNCVILGWVIAGMTKIAEPFMDWQSLLGPAFYGTLHTFFPDALVFGSFDNTITITLLISVTLTYSAMGGIRAVMITDLLQFALAMSMAVILAFMAVQYVGGLEGLWQQLEILYPAVDQAIDDGGPIFLNHERISAFIPSFDSQILGNLGIPFSAFVLTLGFLWWTNGNVDGSGYTQQRMYSAKDGTQAERGVLWFAIAHFAMRTWPWVLVGVAALVVYPRHEVNELAQEFTQCLNDSGSCRVEVQACLDNRYRCDIQGFSLLVRVDELAPALGDSSPSAMTYFIEDRERGYPALMKQILPVGLLGLALASLMAAFMSTVSTQINWSASYVVNDIYLRYLDRGASDQRIVFVSRLATVFIALFGVYVAAHIKSIGAMWELYAGLMAGLGLPHLLRWFWWRATAWTEIAGMLTGLVLALANYFVGQHWGFSESQMSIFPAAMATHPIHVISWTSVIACCVSIAATLMSRPVEDEQLAEFVRRVRPMGFWRGLNDGYTADRNLVESLLYWLLGIVGIYSALFGVGFLLRLELAVGAGLLVIAVASLSAMVVGLNRFDRHRAFE